MTMHDNLAVMLTSIKEKQIIETYEGYYSIIRYTTDYKGINKIISLKGGHADNDNNDNYKKGY